MLNAEQSPDDVPVLADDIVNTLREPLLVLDDHLRIKSASPAFYRVFQVKHEETIGRLIYELGDGQWNIPGLRNLLNELLPGNREGGSFEDYEVEHEFPGLGLRTMLLNARRLPPIGQRKLILLAIEDVTERRKKERKLAEWARLLDLSNDVIIVRDVRNRITYWNHGAEEIFGWTSDQAVGQDLHTLLKTEFEAPFDQLIAKLRHEHRLLGEVVQIAQDGRRVNLLCRWSLDHDAQGNPGAILTTATDITERRQSQEKLRAAHDSFRHLVELSPFGIYSVDADFRLVQVSAGAQKVFENVRPLLGRDFAEVLRIVWPEPFASEAIAIFRRVLESGEPYHAPSTVEKRQDIAAVESYDWKVERLTLPDGRPGAVCHFFDLTVQKEPEALRAGERCVAAFLVAAARGERGAHTTGHGGDGGGDLGMERPHQRDSLGYADVPTLRHPAHSGWLGAIQRLARGGAAGGFAGK